MPVGNHVDPSQSPMTCKVGRCLMCLLKEQRKHMVFETSSASRRTQRTLRTLREGFCKFPKKLETNR